METLPLGRFILILARQTSSQGPEPLVTRGMPAWSGARRTYGFGLANPTRAAIISRRAIAAHSVDAGPGDGSKRSWSVLGPAQRGRTHTRSCVYFWGNEVSWLLLGRAGGNRCQQRRSRPF